MINSIVKRSLTGIVLLLLACNSQSQKEKLVEDSTYTAEEIKAETEKANQFFDKVFDDYVSRTPQTQTRLGIKKDYDKWNDISDAHAQAEIAITTAALTEMKKEINYDKLDEQAKISYKLFDTQSTQEIENFKWRFHNYPVNQLDGLHNDVPSFLINFHRIDSVKDAKAYVARINGVATLFDQLLEDLKIREEKNIIPPRFVFPYVLADAKGMLTGYPFDKSGKNNSLFEDFSTKVNALKKCTADEKKMLLSEAAEAMNKSMRPAYEKFIAYFTELEKKATDDDGAWKFPEGDAYYAAALKATTTTNLTADEIHEIGLKEVARIHAEMHAIMKKVNFKNDNLLEFFDFTRNDKQFYFTNDAKGKEGYRVKAVKIIEDMKAQLDALFITKPMADIVVKPVEAFREKSAAGAFYEEPAIDGTRPGTYYINLYNMNDQVTTQMEALAYHEGIPGHHMQIAISQELKNVPKFRRLGGGNVAYVEGWALYSELVPKELGFYSDPYSDFGRLSMEVFRAARLVVDTGIHSKKWTRKKALQYFHDNTPNPEGDIRKEIERYIVWPSQATGYKIGMMKIMELRKLAQEKLGTKFDIREFHDVILTSGPVPMNVLGDLVTNYISKKLSK
ncbi:MAG TPA: DUF885 domain-containing protein [Bacteroidia bacterium]|nr:DUF885 domain-containing protein [Bacteroidia bacterium]HRH07298.1 DUF885 domain-containing protein [Bacteroidia bacterium]